MGNYIVLCVLLLCAYGVVSMLVAAINNPIRPFAFYVLSIGQAVMLCFMLYGVFISVPVAGTTGYIVFAIYCLLFFLLWLFQVLCNLGNVIVPDKVYDFKLEWYHDNKDGTKTFFGTIKEGFFKTNVFVTGCTEDDLKAATQTPLQVMLKDGAKKSEAIKVYDEKKKVFRVYVYYVHTAKANV